MKKKDSSCSREKSREARLRRLAELIRRNEYEVDAEALADAILKRAEARLAARRPT